MHEKKKFINEHNIIALNVTWVYVLVHNLSYIILKRNTGNMKFMHSCIIIMIDKLSIFFIKY